MNDNWPANDATMERVKDRAYDSHHPKVERNAAIRLEAVMEALTQAGRAEAVDINGEALTITEAVFVGKALNRASKAITEAYAGITPYRRA